MSIIVTRNIRPESPVELAEARNLVKVINAKLRDGMSVKNALAAICNDRPEDHRLNPEEYASYIQGIYGAGIAGGDVQGFEKSDPLMTAVKFLGDKLTEALRAPRN